MTAPQIYVDLDGVLADFEGGYEREFGIRLSKEADNADWDLVRSRPGFYERLTLLPDARELWWFVTALSERPPMILTGYPKSIPSAAVEKCRMVQRELGAYVPVITCHSKDKALYCRPGDILIDDWEKWRSRWIDAGGRWITHTSAASSIQQLSAMLGAPALRPS